VRDATLRQLQIFEAVACHGGFTRAAKALNLTQPAVSMQVRELENHAGLPLLERAGRSVRLTQAGEEVLRYVRSARRAQQDAEDALARLRGLEAGRLAIAAVSTAKYFAPKFLARFTRAHPKVELRLLVHNREAVVQLLIANDVDLALMGTAPAQVETVATPFAPHPLVIVARPDHELSGKRRVPVAALSDETFLVREPGSGTRGAMERYFAQQGFLPRTTLEIGSNETIKQAVMAGMGLGFISLHAIGLELQARQLAVLRVDGLPVIRDWNVVHRRDKRLSPAADAFKAFVLQEGGAFLDRWPPKDLG